jgi:hypothetical protein
VTRWVYQFFVLGCLVAVSFAGQPAAATVSGEDGRIAFVVEIDGTPMIHTMEPDGSDVLVLVDGGFGWI